MKPYRNILILMLSAAAFFKFVEQEALSLALPPSAIYVNAGADQTICVNQNLLMTSLGATISGDVSDGDWISFGDGRFQPGNLITVRYKFAQNNQISYVPGPNDKALGFFRFMLISDAPMGGTPQQKVSDEVMVTFQTAPPLFCSTNINISLNELCTQVVNVTMLQPNPVPPYSNYIITLYDASGNIIPDNTLNRTHIDKDITYKLGHQCSANICWGKFRVEDYFPPLLLCKNDTVLCTRSISPDSLGFPFPPAAYIDTIINNKYIVKNWDACSDVTLEYTDEIIKANCERDEDKTIIRKWKAKDAKGNQSICTEKIVVKRISLAQVVFPPHFDGHDKPAFECSDTFPMLANGHPSPDTTGRPVTGHCGNLQFNMTDVRFDLCGRSFKIARAWFVIDWCTSESITKNQIILVRDISGPEVTCKDTLILYAGAYQCSTVEEEIFSVIQISDCSDVSINYSLTTMAGGQLNQYIQLRQQKYYFSALPVGNYILNNIVTDKCNNTSVCHTIIKVIDKIAPNVVCDQLTKVSVEANGRARVFAFTFDDGSSDNCAISYFKVRKMTDECGFGTQFGDYVDFCCNEIGLTRMVALEVTDIYGNKNTCMVEIKIEDKLKPTLTCPPDLTLECTDNYDFNHLEIFGKVVTKASDVKNITVYNYYHNGVVGKDGLASDNCSVTVSESYTTDIHCHTGTILRKFIARDQTGLKDSCFQKITILNPFPFNESDITWPVHFDSTGCRYDQTDPEITGKPKFKNTACATVAATYEDKKFYIADGACLKIIRSWTVVDWCQFTGTNTAGKWGPYIQIIKLHNTDKPEFTTACRDTIFCSYDTECKNGLVSLTMAAADPCTAVNDLKWTYEIDLFSNGTIDSTGLLREFSGYLPMGKHRVKWKVEDQCGNFNECGYSFSVVDCKKPTPYCLSALTVSLMQVSENIAVWAKDFDKGSTDNCTPADKLKFTFNGESPVDSLLGVQHYFKGNGIKSNESEYKNGEAQIWLPSANSSALIFDCQDLPDGKAALIPVKMVVTDISGNQDFCEVELTVQDNANICPDLITEATVQGLVLTENNIVPQNTQMRCVGPELERTQIINQLNGGYTIDALPLNRNYKLSPYQNSNPLEGVTTLDLVIIQRHILGMTIFNSPYKYIAADVNSSGSVSASDLVELRKLILGITDKFPKNLTSWVFVPKSNGIPDPTNPFSYLNEMETGSLTADIKDADFIAVKIGDVNQSAFNFNDNKTENREAKNDYFDVTAAVEKWGQKQFLVFRAASEINMDGLQLFANLPEARLKPENESDNHTGPNQVERACFIQDEKLRFLQYYNNPHHLQKYEVIRSFELMEEADLSGLTLEADRKIRSV